MQYDTYLDHQSILIKKLYGLVEALKKTDIRFNASERIANIYVKNGQKVSKGQFHFASHHFWQTKVLILQN